jgi:hypothetical protein
MKAGDMQSSREQSILLATCFDAGILLGLFSPEDGGDIFL